MALHPTDVDAMDRDVVLTRYSRHVNASLARLARLTNSPVEVSASGSTVVGSDGHAYLDCGGFGGFLLRHLPPGGGRGGGGPLGRNPPPPPPVLHPPPARAGGGPPPGTPARPGD